MFFKLIHDYLYAISHNNWGEEVSPEVPRKVRPALVIYAVDQNWDKKKMSEVNNERQESRHSYDMIQA